MNVVHPTCAHGDRFDGAPAVPHRSPHRVRIGLAVTAFLVAVAGSVAAVSTGAGAGTSATRGEAEFVGPAPEPPTFGRVVFVSDSALAGIRWSGNLDQLTVADWDPHLESCRRLVHPSCNGREGYAPYTALREIERHADRHGPAAADDVLVIGTGYNDWESRFRDDFRAVVATARAEGFRRIVWLTYRDDTSYRLPGGVGGASANYAAMNEILFDELATGDHPDLALWDYRTFTAGHPEWFTYDGVHVTAEGAVAVAGWLSSHFSLDDSPPWITS